MCKRVAAALLLCALAVGAAALPSSGLRSRRALRQQEAQQTILGQPVQELTFQNTCDDFGVDYRLHFSFDGDYPWFSSEVTDVIPNIFVDYFCDNIGAVNYQFAPPDNRMNDSDVQEALRNGTCFNEFVMLRTPSWQGRGPQKELSLEFPEGTVWDMHLAINSENGAASAISVSPDGTEGSGVWRTADFGEECEAGEEGCMEWHKVSLEGLKPTVTFECAAKSSKGSKKKSGSF